MYLHNKHCTNNNWSARFPSALQHNKRNLTSKASQPVSYSVLQIQLNKGSWQPVLLNDHSSSCRTLFFGCQAHLPFSFPLPIFSLDRYKTGEHAETCRLISCLSASAQQQKSKGVIQQGIAKYFASSGSLFFPFVNTILLWRFCWVVPPVQNFQWRGRRWIISLLRILSVLKFMSSWSQFFFKINEI